jgi:hypothetical protein
VPNEIHMSMPLMLRHSLMSRPYYGKPQVIKKSNRAFLATSRDERSKMKQPAIGEESNARHKQYHFTDELI